MSQIEIINELKADDGSYVLSVRHYGLEFVVHFISGEIRVYGTNTSNKRLDWKLSASAKAVKRFAADRIASFGPAFMDAHRDLYEMNN